MAAERKVTLEELNEHNKTGDLWIVVHGKVYDVSDFMDEHPGGGDVLLDTAGADATDEFEDIGHSETSRIQMEGMLVGTLEGSLGGGSGSKVGGSGASSGGGSSMMVPVLVLLLAVAFFMFKDQILAAAN